MPTYTLAVNTAFAVKRWPLADEWAEVAVNELGVDTIQHSLDLIDLDGPAKWTQAQAQETRRATERVGLSLHSTFTGLAAYSLNLLLHPAAPARDRAERWFEKAISFTALAGGRATGGHVGAFGLSSISDPQQRERLWQGMREAIARLTHRAQESGLNSFLIENMAVAREPSSTEEIDDLLAIADAALPIELCLDIGHQCIPGRSLQENDPYFWLNHFRDRATVIHLQQSDALSDHHWPFTPERNSQGRIKADRVLDILDGSTQDEMVLVLEVIPPFEAIDDAVLTDMKTSVDYWQDAIRRRTQVTK
jgi:D-erythrulose 1-phosphate 3-epimerase